MSALILPPWAVAGEKRRAHIGRVVALLDQWSAALNLGAAERREWLDAGRLHDALRDADERQLRAILPGSHLPAELLHGPAAARLLERDGERRRALLDAITHHTAGWAGWTATGRALYCADFLEPGRKFAREERAALAASFPDDPETVLQTVVAMRISRALQSHHPVRTETTELWNSLL